MDGLKNKVTPSLQVELSAWLSVAIISIAAMAATLAFMSALDEAHDNQDKQLRQTADLISRFNALPGAQSPVTSLTGGVHNIDFGERVVLRILADRSGPRQGTGQRAPVFSNLLTDGLQTVQVGREQWRVFVLTTNYKMRLAVAQQTSTRDALARTHALRTLWPFLALVPVLLLLVAVLLRQMFKPLRILAADLARRSEHDLRRLDEAGLPSEVLPFVTAINSLLMRFGRAMVLQRRFVADAAHELRSPLTAMSLQAEWLSATALPHEAGVRLAALRDGLARTRVLLDQLLSMARSQESRLEAVEEISLQQVIRQVLEDLVPLAEDKHIDLGVVGDGDAGIMAHQVDLMVLVKNLVDNAIRYTPDGGSVDISINSERLPITLQVDDTGPGISVRERERVFDPFYRVLGSGQVGSGLGLSIVRTIAASIDAEVALFDAPPPRPGLRVVVTFNRARPRSGQPEAADRLPGL